MKKYTILIVVVLFIQLLIFTSCSSHLTAERMQRFQESQESFTLIKNRILKCDDNSYGVMYENHKVVGLHGIDFLTDNELDALNSVYSVFSQDFSFIEKDGNRISFGGNGSEMYVYTEGEKSYYFYCKGDHINFSVEEITDNWYFLYNTAR